MPLLISLAFLFCMIMATVAHGRGDRRGIYRFKPASTALLVPLAMVLAVVSAPLTWQSLLWPFVSTPSAVVPSVSSASGLSAYSLWIIAGLLLSLAGDVFLMLPTDRFREGLASFFLAHVAYLGAFATDSGWAANPLPYVLIGLAGLAMLPMIWPGVPRALRIPVLCYMLVLLVMAAQAGSRALELRSLPAAGAAVGAILFVVSDTLLAWNRFRRPFAAAPVLVHATYFPAQWLIAMSVLR